MFDMPFFIPMVNCQRQFFNINKVNKKILICNYIRFYFLTLEYKIIIEQF